MNGSDNNSRRYNILLAMNYVMLFVGSLSSTLLSKFYFNHKGSNKWVATWVQSAGFPFLVPPIFIPYFLGYTERKPFFNFTRKVFVLSIGIGFMLGFNNLLFSWGNSYLPVSTSALLLSSQLVFTLILSVIIVKQKINFSNMNCVMLLTLSSVLLALSSDHDMPQGLSRSKYLIGFFSTIGAGLLFALYLPVMEKVYGRINCYSMVMEMQLVMEIAATVLPTVGMIIDGGVAEWRRESEMVFDLGSKLYWLTIFFNVLTWQMCFMGTAGTVFLTTSLTGGVCMTSLMGINVLGGVIVYGDKFSEIKVVSFILCLWGFCSYLYGLYVLRQNKSTIEGAQYEGDHELVMVASS